jgi:hypothetical protein
MRLRPFAILAIAACVAACATKTPVPTPPPAQLADIGADDYTCKPDQSASVDFHMVIAAPERYYDKCIRVRALFRGGALWENATAFQSKSAAIALYSRNGNAAASAASHPYFVGVVGRLRYCPERMRRLASLSPHAEAPVASAPTAPTGGAVNILTSYCYGVQGPALFASSVDTLPTAMD